MKFGFLAVVLLFFLNANSQVTISEESKISRLMNSYISESKSNDYMQAWRIQLITTNDRRKMENVRSKFASLYPGYNISWKHVSPYYHVQTGAFRTKLELQGFLIQLKQDFPNAIPVMDKIKKTELLN